MIKSYEEMDENKLHASDNNNNQSKNNSIRKIVPREKHASEYTQYGQLKKIMIGFYAGNFVADETLDQNEKDNKYHIDIMDAIYLAMILNNDINNNNMDREEDNQNCDTFDLYLIFWFVIILFHKDNQNQFHIHLLDPIEQVFGCIE